MKDIIGLMLFICLFFACNVSDELVELSNGWLYVSEGKHQNALDGGNIFIPCEITSYGYDDNFIIASQKPINECFLRNHTFEYTQGKDSTYYWLVIHKSNELLGPMVKEEYLKVRAKYSVPEDLQLRNL